MSEYALDKNRKLIFFDTFFCVIRNNALIDSNKEVKFCYDDIKAINYQDTKVNWVKSTINFLPMTFFEAYGNPVSGKEKTFEITMNNGEKRFINMETASKTVIRELTKEFSIRIR
ncbi:hypothetical protein RCC89_19275 [Cytophagaceae bacterium ABcell3]|nr:hypothetical protein RCC89_19275 [Cytophagaceae bacterium ABcell3]